MTSTYRNFNTRETPQNQPISGSAQVPNSAGGFAFGIDDWAKLDRFLVLGTEGGTYYIKEQELTRQNAEAVMRCIQADGPRVLDRISEISVSGRAARNDPAIFALALAISFGDTVTKQSAANIVSAVCRTGTHLLHFAQYCNQFRGWGRALKTAVRNWYEEKDAASLAYQMVKYRQRDGWSHRDLVQLTHPKRNNGALFDWVMGSEGREQTVVVDSLPKIIEGFEVIQHAADAKETARLINEYRLPREAVPTQFLTEAGVWEALLETDMPYEAMIRNLGNMGKAGLLKPMSAAASRIVTKLADGEALRRARVHPIKLLAALRTYAGGKGFRGSNEWEVVTPVVDALDAAFYQSFQHVEPTGKRTMLALDVSGSMGSPLMNMPYLTCRDGSAAMALVTANVEPNHMFICFASGDSPSKWGSRYNTGIKALDISPRQRLDDVVKKMSGIPFGGTDCALPMLYASAEKLDIDNFVIYTDNETWHGGIHPSQALQRYRQERGINAKLSVVGMEGNAFSIADPADKGMMDFCGFDTATPEAISAFARE